MSTIAIQNTTPTIPAVRTKEELEAEKVRFVALCGADATGRFSGPSKTMGRTLLDHGFDYAEAVVIVTKARGVLAQQFPGGDVKSVAYSAKGISVRTAGESAKGLTRTVLLEFALAAHVANREGLNASGIGFNLALSGDFVEQLRSYLK